MKRPSKAVIAGIAMLFIVNAWAFTVNDVVAIKLIVGAIDVFILYYGYKKFGGKFSFLSAAPVKKKEGVKNYCPECGQRIDTPTCDTCGRDIKK